ASSTLPSSNSAVAQANSWAVYTMQGKPIPSTTTGASATFFYPSNDTSAVVVTALTIGNALNYTVTQISVIPSVNTAENIQFYLAIGASNTNYTILYQINTDLTIKNGTTIVSTPLNIQMPPDYYTFPAKDKIIFLIKNATLGSEFSASVTLKGSTNPAVNILLSPVGAIDISLILLGISALVLGIFSIPWIELHTDKVVGYAKRGIRKVR
ncbi:MAG: hypothetical protein ACP5L4_07185, partial [Thermoplasmata archaeon]